jgi:hypothetical protein
MQNSNDKEISTDEIHTEYKRTQKKKLVEALHCKAEGCGFDSRWDHWKFSVT